MAVDAIAPRDPADALPRGNTEAGRDERAVEGEAEDGVTRRPSPASAWSPPTDDR